MKKLQFFTLFLMLFAFSAVLFAQDELITLKNGFEQRTESHAVLVAQDEAILSSPITGRISKINVRPGQSFKKGKILLQFDCSTQEAEKEKAQAEVKGTKIAWESAQELERLESVSKTEAAKAEANYKKSVAEVKRLDSILDKCTIRAPFNGQAVEIMVHAHEARKPGEPLMEIINNRDLEVKLYVPSIWLRWIKIGSKFSIQFKELARSYKAHITKIGAKIDATSQTVQIFGKLDNPDRYLIGGMSGVATFKDQA